MALLPLVINTPVKQLRDSNHEALRFLPVGLRLPLRYHDADDADD